MEQSRNVAAVKLALNHYLQQMRINWRLVLPAMLLPGVAATLVFYVPPLIISKIFTSYISGGAQPQILLHISLIAGVWFLGEMLWRIAIHFMIKSEVKGIRQLYINALDYLLAKDISFFNDHFAGSLTKKTVGYAKNFEGFSDTLSFNVASRVLPLFFIVYVLWQFSPWLAITLLGGIAVTLSALIPLIKRRQKLVAKRETASNVLAGNVADTLTNMPAVRAFAHEGFEAKRHKTNVFDFAHKTEKTWHFQNLKVDMLTAPLYILTNVAGLAVALVVGKNSGANIQTLFITFTYYAHFSLVFWEFNRIYRHIESAITDAAQFTELLLEEPKINDPLKPEKFEFKKGEVDFKNVSFRYGDTSEEHLFKDFNLKIKSGEKVGLVGHSGGGKTTVTRLLMRFMDVEGGAVLIDGQNIAMARQADFRAHIAYVPQEPALFHRSLSDNIRYGELDATGGEVKKAAKMAHAAEFIERLPKGYETLVGERGVKLSGGQRQRIAIARAMLKNAPILVLDEATSSLDSESEKLIQKALWKLMVGRTAIVIAHRLSTVQKMDRIVVLEEGRIVEEGTHKQLLAKNGRYATLWKHQSGGFLEE